ncbi:MAG: L-lactate permease [Gemmatimonadaceae bacterium]
MAWSQNYDPLHNPVVSTLLAAVPVVVLLGSLAVLRLKAHTAALLGLVAALAIAIGVVGMPADMAVRTAAFGAAYGLFPIGWIVLNVIFLYQLTREKGYFAVLQTSIAGVTTDRRLQLCLVAFSFGAFFEGAAGFGAPVAVTGALLIGLGFSPLQASGLSLIANTAPVAFGALGTPIVALNGVTGIDIGALSAMVGRQLPVFSVIIPFWLIWAYVGFRHMIAVWPALLVAGITFAIPQFLISNFHGPWLVDVVSAVISMACTAGFLKVWQPRDGWTPAAADDDTVPRTSAAAPPAGDASRAVGVFRAWLPWIILSVFVFVWGTPQAKTFLNALSAPKWPVAGLDKLVLRVPPVVAKDTAEGAVYIFNWLSATGTSILLAALAGGSVMGYSVRDLVVRYGRTLRLVTASLVTIAAMMAIGYTTRYSGTDAIMGLAFAKTGVLYPFFGTMLGWLGVALTGSDTSSNVLFGSLQKITSQQLGLSPTLMAAANSSGGVMGKMIDAQSIVVASTATRWYGQEWAILRYVFFHSLALAGLVSLLVYLQAYVVPFTRMVVR